MKPRYLWMRPWLGTLLALTLLGLTVYMTVQIFTSPEGWKAIPEAIKMLYVGMVQALIVMTTTSHGFYFGTSQGSSNKSETLDKMLNGSSVSTTTRRSPDSVIVNEVREE